MALLLLGAVLAAVSAPAARADDALDFSASLTSPSPYLSVPAGKYGHTGSGLLRTQSDSGTNNGTDRPMVKTVSSAFLTEDFVAELTVRSSGNGDIIYFGLGPGTPKANYFNEPVDSAIFRIHNPPVWNGVHAAYQALSAPAGSFAYITQIGSYSNGPTTFRLERHGDSVTLSIPGQGGSGTISLSAVATAINASNSYLFFGNTSEGTTFSNFSVHRPITYSWSAGAFGACSATCGGGTQTRSVTCLGSDSNAYPDSSCTDPKPSTSQLCNTQPCPVDCVVASSGFGPCSVSCGGGLQTEILTVVTPAANGGAACRAPNSQSCNTQPCDSDGDGVPDTSDLCPGTPSGARVDAGGCSGAQLVAKACPAGGSYKNHGAYVSCVDKAADAAEKAGLLTHREEEALVTAAAHSAIGKKPGDKDDDDKDDHGKDGHDKDGHDKDSHGKGGHGR